jgi:hypothetical protein
VHLRAFQYQVFMEFRQVFDDSGDFARLAASLEGRGVPDILEALIEMRLKPVQDAFRDMFDDHSLKLMRALGWGKPIPEGVHKKDVVSLVERYERFLVSVSGYLGGARVSHSAVPKLRADLKQDLERLLEGESLPSAPGRPHPAFLLVWFLTAGLGRLVSKDDVPAAGAALIDTLRLGPMNASRAGEGAEDGASALTAGLLRLLIRFQLTCVPDSEADLLRGVREMLDDPGVQAHLGVNSHEGVMYYNKESFETLLGWLFFTGSLIRACEAPPAQRFSPTTAAGGSAQAHSAKILALSERSGYRLEELRRLLEVPAIPHTIS